MVLDANDPENREEIKWRMANHVFKVRKSPVPHPTDPEEQVFAPHMTNYLGVLSPEVHVQTETDSTPRLVPNPRWVKEQQAAYYGLNWKTHEETETDGDGRKKVKEVLEHVPLPGYGTQMVANEQYIGDALLQYAEALRDGDVKQLKVLDNVVTARKPDGQTKTMDEFKSVLKYAGIVEDRNVRGYKYADMAVEMAEAAQVDKEIQCSQKAKYSTHIDQTVMQLRDWYGRNHDTMWLKKYVEEDFEIDRNGHRILAADGVDFKKKCYWMDAREYKDSTKSPGHIMQK